MREFIVEADGGSRGNPGPAGTAASCVTRRRARRWWSGPSHRTATNNVAEYRGLLAGLSAARELDPAARVHVRMDSKLVVEQMSGRWKIRHPDMRPLAMRAAPSSRPGRSRTSGSRARAKQARGPARQRGDGRGSRGERWDAPGPPREPDARGATLHEPPGPAATSRRSRSPRRPTARGAGRRRVRAPMRAPPAMSPPPRPTWVPPPLRAAAHGETPLTRSSGLGSGGDDPALSDVGRRQAELVAAALAARGPSRPWSPRPRALPRPPGPSQPASARGSGTKGCARPTSVPGRADVRRSAREVPPT
ncbi:reverse transcriptase-like protein [Streptomyces sp. T1317-0309]|nr:reverse transcriptase-like protein [Streptomyces sp. T1317-0309]